MAKYLWQVSYTPQGVQGLQKEGGAARRAFVQQITEKAGGKLEAFYFALGESDLYAIVDLPDATTAMSISITVNAAGAAALRTIPLVTPEEMDRAMGQTVAYRVPGTR
ncbi:MAG: GYD domain-containing protein [Chloroflexota bacterium]|nr:GYD domain-containing protein [Chloroflexota bacterium]